MKIERNYTQNLPVSTNTNISQENTTEQSFEDVLVLNQMALKAMTIDEMVKESTTGSVNPEAVDAAAIMKFRSTLPDNIKAPIPTDDWCGGSPIVANMSSNTIGNILNDVNIDTSFKAGDVYNEGVLKCSDELNSYFKEAAEIYNVDVKLLKSIARAESNFNPSVVSHAGAIGVMQLMPSTAAGLGVSNAYDARHNILGGAKYISQMLNKYNGNVSLALAAYNAGPGAVNKYNGIPPYEETQNYVVKVQGYYNS